MTTLLFAAWIGLASLGITPEQSYDHGLYSDCQVLITCRTGETFTHFSFDVNDVAPIANVTYFNEGVTAWNAGQLSWDGLTLRYDTGTGYVWTPAVIGHFLFLRNTAGQFFAAIEDMPPVWVNSQGEHVSTDLDYNDRMYRIDLQPVPEPASLGLLGLGLVGAARSIRRKRRQQRAAAV